MDCKPTHPGSIPGRASYQKGKNYDPTIFVTDDCVSRSINHCRSMESNSIQFADAYCTGTSNRIPCSNDPSNGGVMEKRNELVWEEGMVRVAMSERIIAHIITVDRAAEVYGPIRIAHNPVRKRNDSGNRLACADDSNRASSSGNDPTKTNQS